VRKAPSLPDLTVHLDEPAATVAGLTADTGVRGYTPRELARLLRVSPDRIRAMIATGELGALDLARHRCGRPRYVILPHHLAEFVRRRAAGPSPTPARRRKRIHEVDYYPD
jgi:excisionase family DNA binding protein